MTRFAVWAPAAQHVAVQVGNQRVPLVAQEAGWWATDVPQARPGTTPCCLSAATRALHSARIDAATDLPSMILAAADDMASW